ncbi:MAG: DegV family protein [Lachnospiraceae bacterium]|nr:DegV family protein [Lachnospiraceae bacterium]
MSYKIIGDSCLDLTKELKANPRYQMVPLTLQVDDVMVVDDETFDQKAFIGRVKASPNCPKTACPSPEAFKEAYACDAENVYVITLSSHLSGTYNSAVLGKSLYEEEFGPKNILVIDSESASSGELNLALSIGEWEEEGLSFEEVSRRVLALRNAQKTYFVIDSLEPLRKNGRLTGLQAFFATALNIKPVMGAEQGVILKLDQARGVSKAFAKMCEIAVRQGKDTTTKRVVIAHCNCPDRAQFVKEELERRAAFREIVTTETAGVATVYAGDGGIVLVVG